MAGMPFAERSMAGAPRLWITGQAARNGWRGPATAGQRHPGHGAECGVHSLWIRLLIRMWGHKVNTR
jgi:hypothetical protein